MGLGEEEDRGEETRGEETERKGKIFKIRV